MLFRLARFSHPAASAASEPVGVDTGCGSVDALEQGSLPDRVLSALRTVYDPEIPVNVYDLGLIYRLDVSDFGSVDVDMTLTAPACPVAELMPVMVEKAIRQVEGVTEVKVQLVWDPPWTMDRMTDEAKLEVGLL